MTKKERAERAAKEALKRRLLDIAAGAHGDYEPPDYEHRDFTGMASEMGIEGFGRWIGGIKTALLTNGQEWLVKPSNYRHFDFIKDAVDYLYESGVRA